MHCGCASLESRATKEPPVNQNDKSEKTPAKPLRTLGNDALRQVNGAFDAHSKDPALVASTWNGGLVTTPGQPTDTPGTNPDGNGPLP